MIDAPLALAFTAGLVATVNPCGFVMLPAYLSSFLGADAPTATPAAIARALAVGAAVSIGFVTVFALVAAAIRLAAIPVLDVAPWFGLAIGVVLVGVGAAQLAGHPVRLALPHLDRGGTSGSLRSMTLFGVSYAVASLSCTLPLFLSLVAGTFTRSNAAAGLVTFGAYAAGVALVLIALAVALAAARGRFVRVLRASSRHTERVAGALLVLAGAYLTYYWAVALTGGSGDGLIRTVENLSASASAAVQSWGALWVGGVLVTVVVAGVAVARTRRRTTEPQPALDADAA